MTHNGAAGIVPGVLHYYMHFVSGANGQGVIDFLLTAAAIGILYMENASIWGAAARGGLAVNVIEC